MDSKVLSGSTWTSQDIEFFIVEKIESKDSEDWIYYHKRKNPDQSYCCLVGAFLNRFKLYDNS